MAFKVRMDINRAVSVTLVTGRSETHPGEYATEERLFLPGARIPDNVAPWIIERWNAGDKYLRSRLEVDGEGAPGLVASQPEEPATPAPGLEQAPVAIDYSSLSKEQLVQLASERGLDVVRLDGGDGAPRKEDYVAALTVNDQTPAQSSNPFEAAA